MSHYNFYVEYKPQQDVGDPLSQRALVIAKLAGPYVNPIMPNADARQYGFWLTAQSSEEEIKQRLYDMFVGVVKEYKELRNG